MRAMLLVAGLALLSATLGCGSDNSPGTGNGTNAGGTATGGNHSMGGVATGGTNAGGTNTGGTNTGGTNASGMATGGAAGTLSAACQMYCECHQKNCATSPIPGGATCADFCAGMTAEQLSCRQNMCGLVPAQPNNDHCKHSLGIDQCQ